MSADAARDPELAIEQERLKKAGRRLRSAQEEYNKLVDATSIEGAGLKLVEDDLHAAEMELRAAQEEFLPLYAQHLREDPDFKRKSEEAERRLAEGPPWDDLITPADLRARGASTDR